MTVQNNETLHSRVRQYVLDLIQQQDLKPGDILPSETELEAVLNTSRTTIRSALIELQHEGYIVRRQGKGTFVADITYEEHLTKLTGFAEDNESQGKRVTSLVISANRIFPTEEISMKLRVNEDDPVFKLQRVRLVDGEAAQLTTAYLPPKLTNAIDLAQVDFTIQPLYGLIEELGFEIYDGEEIIELVYADPIQASLLQVPEGFPLFATIRRVNGKDGMPLEYSISYTRGDRHRTHIYLKR